MEMTSGVGGDYQRAEDYTPIKTKYFGVISFTKGREKCSWELNKSGLLVLFLSSATHVLCELGQVTSPQCPYL